MTVLGGQQQPVGKAVLVFLCSFVGAISLAGALTY
jgi:hypothetical protein